MDRSDRLTTPRDDDLKAALEAAEQAVAELAENFTVWAREDIERMAGALERARAAPGDNAAEMEEIFGFAHNIKGQAGSFGYELMTRIGGMLCHHVRDVGAADEALLKVIDGYILSLRFIVDRRIDGDGGEVGQKLVDKLEDLSSVLT